MGEDNNEIMIKEHEEHVEEENVDDNLDEVNENVDVPEEDVHNDINNEIPADDNTVESLAKHAEEVGVVHMDDIDNVHPEDVPAPIRPPRPEISDENILPEGR